MELQGEGKLLAAGDWNETWEDSWVSIWAEIFGLDYAGLQGIWSTRWSGNRVIDYFRQKGTQLTSLRALPMVISDHKIIETTFKGAVPARCEWKFKRAHAFKQPEWLTSERWAA